MNSASSACANVLMLIGKSTANIPRCMLIGTIATMTYGPAIFQASAVPTTVRESTLSSVMKADLVGLPCAPGVRFMFSAQWL